MANLYLIVIIYLITPATLSIILNLVKKNHLLEESYSFRIIKEIKTSFILLATLVWLGVFLLIVDYGYIRITNKSNPSIAVLIFTLISIPSILLALKVFQETWLYKEFSSLFKLTLTFATILITWAASNFAFSYISSATSLSATEFPTAVAGLTLLYAPILWGMVMPFGLLIVYVTSGLALVLLPFFFKKNPEKHEKIQESKIAFIVISLFVGMASSIVISLTGSETISKSDWFKNKELLILIYSGYPLSSHKCAKDIKKDSQLTILSSEKIGVAEPIDDNKYKFYTIECLKTVDTPNNASGE